MNATTNAGLSLKLASEKCFPLGSGNWKSGALVPSDNIVEGVNAMRGENLEIRRSDVEMEHHGQGYS